MKYRLVVVIALLALSDPVSAEKHRWLHYLNARFGTCADYPGDVFTQRFYPDNGDGVRFKARGGAELTISGSWNVDGHTPMSFQAFLNRNEPHRYTAIAYRVMKPKLLILSGNENRRIFFERYAFGDPSGAVHSLVVEYPVELRSRFEPLIARMSRSLCWASNGGQSSVLPAANLIDRL
jgi:hypothetical protein